MPSLLSRIEREYILKHMGETLPAVSIRVGSEYFDIAALSYRILGTSIELDPINVSLSKSVFHERECEVFFSHRKRAMFFKSSLSVADISVGECSVKINIPNDFYKTADTEIPAATCKLKVDCSSSRLEFRASPSFPLDLDYIDPEEVSSSAITMNKVMTRLGIGTPGDATQIVAHRIKEFLDCVTSTENPGQWISSILYIDGSTILVTVGETHLSELISDAKFHVSIQYGLRTIKCDSFLIGTVPVTRGISLVCISFSDIKPEDRRFLHETAHRDKYIG